MTVGHHRHSDQNRPLSVDILGVVLAQPVEQFRLELILRILGALQPDDFVNALAFDRRGSGPTRWQARP
jgi:hypothetical protein